MRKNNTRISTDLLRKATLCLTLILALAWSTNGTASATQPPITPIINRVYVTSLTDNGVVISWTTDRAASGDVDWGIITDPLPLANTTSDPVAADTSTHYIVIDQGLIPETTYRFQVRSDDATDDNDGAYYTFATGPTLALTTPAGTMWGFLFESDGSTPVPNAIVYLQIVDSDGLGSAGESQWVSTRTASNGAWAHTFGGERTSDASAHFNYTPGPGGDQVRVVWQGGILGCVGESPGDHRYLGIPASGLQQEDMSLDGDPTAVRITDLSVKSGNTNLAGIALATIAVVTIAVMLVRRRHTGVA